MRFEKDPFLPKQVQAPNAKLAIRHSQDRYFPIAAPAVFADTQKYAESNSPPTRGRLAADRGVLAGLPATDPDPAGHKTKSVDRFSKKFASQFTLSHTLEQLTKDRPGNESRSRQIPGVFWQIWRSAIGLKK